LLTLSGTFNDCLALFTALFADCINLEFGDGDIDDLALPSGIALLANPAGDEVEFACFPK
jgi:hypothetical protein